MENAAEIIILSKKDPVHLDLLLSSNLVQQELSRMNINSLSLQVTPQLFSYEHKQPLIAGQPHVTSGDSSKRPGQRGLSRP